MDELEDLESRELGVNWYIWTSLRLDDLIFRQVWVPDDIYIEEFDTREFI